MKKAAKYLLTVLAALGLCVIVAIALAVAYWNGVFHDKRDPSRLASAVRVDLYDVPASGEPRSEEDFENIASDTFDIGLFRRAVKTCRFRAGPVISFGSSLAIVHYPDGERDYIKIFYHGFTFRFIGEPFEYQISPQYQEAWDRERRRIITDVFMPKRQEAIEKREGETSR